MDRDERRAYLVHGLVDENADVYHYSFEYHVAIDSLAEVMMNVSDLLADGGRWRLQERKRQVDASAVASSFTVHKDPYRNPERGT